VLLRVAPPQSIRESPVLKLARRIHDPLLRWAMRNPLAVLVVAVGLARPGCCCRGSAEFLPELNEGSLYVTFTLPPTCP
jgi:cobalt-zinc-cadmium resistance protein CzcA